MSSPYLPNWATAQEASAWLQAETGEQWPLVRLVETVHKMSVWIDCSDDEPEHIVEGLFQGQREGFRAPVMFGSDIERLKFVRDGGTLHISQRPDGTLVKFTPPIRFPIEELRFEADCLRRVAAIVGRPALAMMSDAADKSAQGGQEASTWAFRRGPATDARASKEMLTSAHMTIAEAKQWILESSPRELFTDFYAGADGAVEAITDGSPRSIFADHLDADFAANCAQLGIEPRWKYRPGLTGYTGAPATDALYTITRDEVAQLANLYGLTLDSTFAFSGVSQPAAEQAAELDEAPPLAITSETPKARRARLLQCREEETTLRGEHGALARVVIREKLIRPTADRSNIRKDIEKAKKERHEEIQAGARRWPLG